ncbi:RagB/SusD family nutrient uptake outer membrane protein [Muricauda sp. 2012CJ35-5]|uniref:RagB/SusD family nutrient uptake outer membrane protein n=1 Tax=Flagellimonas spongiicola TaxID=2942208 RepID=A0ABT0PQU6_9FLAO|nr:RagB/SusD family nutrient uptake outer membrane protein [Allomuricauda spongiicola]MCL6273744.1 RagB/SusD family nutrient uptake outer membrane protein [Allomuricauda spongiicola]
MKNIKNLILLGILVVFANSCDKVYLDPNSTLEPDVVNSTDNLVALINGVQQRWSTDRAGIIYTSVHLTGLNTGELRLLNPGNLGENEVLLGGDDINGGNEILNNIWTNAMLCRKEATTVITAADNASEDSSVANSLKAYGLFYRALVHGTLIQYFESIPLEIIEDAPFVSRDAVLQNAIADLTEAQGYIQSGLAAQITSGVFSSVDLGNSVNALLARFNLMTGNYGEAISAANNVDTAVQSTWEYDAAIPNPLSFWFGSQNVTQARDVSFTLPASLAPDAADERVPFYVTADDFNAPSPDYQILGFFDDNLKEIPVYLPGELMLIKAEAYARSNDLTNAVNELNDVLTKTAAGDTYGVGANLPAYAGAVDQQSILDEIYRNRRIELYLTGLGLEDSRRFNRPGPSDANPERNRNYYPYPNAERDNNSNTPANPSS